MPMNLLFRVIYAAHANGTHHKLALDALRHLQTDHASAWRALFLKHVELYLAGAKAPDEDFKDFKNHVLYVRDNYWGGAPEKCESWYKKLVNEIQQENWEQAVWCAGVLSHYYMDPIHPFHTAQSEAENNIHRAVEWSICQSYDDLRKIGLKYPIPAIHTDTSETWLKGMVIAGAELANCDYEALIAGYNFELGVMDPPAGLDATSRKLIGRLLVYASYGFSRILDRAFEEAGVMGPDVAIAMQTVTATIKTPLKWINNKIENAKQAQLVKQMYDEYCKTGRVCEKLGEDNKVLRDLYETEVWASLIAHRKKQRAERRTRSPLPQGNFFNLRSTPVITKEITKPSTSEKKDNTIIDSDVSLIKTHLSEEKNQSRVHKNKTVHSVKSSREVISRSYLELTDAIKAAPSIEHKTAKHLEAAGIVTVQDFLSAQPKELAQKLNMRHVRHKTIMNWQDQARLMVHIAGLRVVHSQLCVGAGFRSPEAIAYANAEDLNVAILKFSATSKGKQILGKSKPPDIYAIKGWMSAIERTLAA